MVEAQHCGIGLSTARRRDEIPRPLCGAAHARAQRGPTDAETARKHNLDPESGEPQTASRSPHPSETARCCCPRARCVRECSDPSHSEPIASDDPFSKRIQSTCSESLYANRTVLHAIAPSIARKVIPSATMLQAFRERDALRSADANVRPHQQTIPRAILP